ncbi:MBL fold metallo-hydrolase [Pseudogracilibacillus sp. SE30717A]|uniref:MBL fold metallo-hydrolase n=1 Tax=Pseudogracilibacillus sp. SE30717A TaxID=3098293 RepID=UPI00300E51A8
MLDEFGIKKVKISLPFRLDHVNCFFAEGNDGYVIIDTGLNDHAAQKTWKPLIQNNKIESILLTHLHPDHCGYAGKLQEITRSAVYMSERDAIALNRIWTEEAIPKLVDDYHRADIDKTITKEIVGATKNSLPFVTPLPTINHYLTEGEKIKFGKYEYEILFTPGHSEGLICLYNRDKHLLFSTDHILPKITPNISYWFYGEENPLLSYEHSLNKIKQLDIDYVIPSHGEPFTNVNRRIEEIWKHHVQNFEVILDAIKDSRTIFDVCKILFPRDLTTYDYQFAIGETIAHLNYLRLKGECRRELVAGKWMYKREN